MKNNGWKIVDLKNAMMVSTFFFLWLAVFLGESVEELLAFALIFTFGILHGANDLEILRRKASTNPLKRSGIVLLLAYVGFVGISAVMFYFIPELALALFILFSAYHFGEQHWIKRRGIHGLLQKVLFLSYGMVVLFLLFLAHSTQVLGVIEDISGISIQAITIRYILYFSFSVFLMTLFANYYMNQFFRYTFKELLLLGLFFLVFNTASLVWAFAIYFVVWHSIPSLADQVRLLYGSVSLKNGKKYLKSSAIYWMGALGTLALAFLFLRESDHGYLPLFFSFLAAITFPHVLVITRLYGGGEPE